MVENHSPTTGYALVTLFQWTLHVSLGAVGNRTEPWSCGLLSGAQPLLWQCWIWSVPQLLQKVRVIQGRHFTTFYNFEDFRSGKLCGQLRRACGDERSLLSRHGKRMETGCGIVGPCPLTEGRRKKLNLQNVQVWQDFLILFALFNLFGQQVFEHIVFQ